MKLPAALPAPASLHEVVHRAHLKMALIAVLLAALMLVLAGLLVLRAYMVSNLHLVARSLAYTVEAAVVFGDRPEASTILQRMVASDGTRCFWNGSRAMAGWAMRWGTAWRAGCSCPPQWRPSTPTALPWAG